MQCTRALVVGNYTYIDAFVSSLDIMLSLKLAALSQTLQTFHMET